MVNELESRDDGGCWSTCPPHTHSVLGSLPSTANGKGDKGKCVTGLGQRYLGAGTMANMVP